MARWLSGIAVEVKGGSVLIFAQFDLLLPVDAVDPFLGTKMAI
jgi:hypothetical protein